MLDGLVRRAAQRAERDEKVLLVRTRPSFMAARAPSTTNCTGGMASWASRLALGVALALSVTVWGRLIVTGPHVQAAAEAKEARLVEEEDRAFCSGLGIGLGTTRFAQCTAGLKDIRRRYLERSLGRLSF